MIKIIIPTYDVYYRKKIECTWSEFKNDATKYIFKYEKHFTQSLKGKITWKIRYQVAFLIWLYKRIIGDWYKE